MFSGVHQPSLTDQPIEEEEKEEGNDNLSVLLNCEKLEKRGKGILRQQQMWLSEDREKLEKQKML